MNFLKKKVIVGMSGGVDSSVSAWLLKKQGYQVEGLFMKNWEEDDNNQYCNAKKDLLDVRSVCSKLNIKLHTINFSTEYWENVFQCILTKYKNGYTPNPDILCNKEIKFKIFMNFALNNLKADYIATGHYVRYLNIDNKCYLLNSYDKKKDQSYFLYTLNYKKIKNCLFPVGYLKKIEVRNIAKLLNLTVAFKKDSVGICFIGKKNFKNFISKYLPPNPGPIYSIDGNKIGIHQGLMYYTLGQRKGLNIGGLKNYKDGPWYVIRKDINNNKLIVTQNKYPKLLSNNFIIHNVYWIINKKINTVIYCKVKIRYQQYSTYCKLIPEKNKCLQIITKYPLLSITPGQSAVFYLNKYCLGGGIIKMY